ncbi:MAG: hypothetical protein QOF76_560, partial [Solirubrobacteraceae bacterium]|nr:hypothetical protein [Solirubrobacteraceae bacterium]
LQCVSGSGRVSEHLAGERKSATVLCVYGQHLPCLLPQHGPGKKHTREIRLELWQEGVVAEHPWLLLRGLIQSDGCRFINRTGKYAYPSYDFSNLSTGIKEIFADACARVGAECRPYKRGVRINAREAVAAFDVHVGPKR